MSFDKIYDGGLAEVGTPWVHFLVHLLFLIFVQWLHCSKCLLYRAFNGEKQIVVSHCCVVNT